MKKIFVVFCITVSTFGYSQEKEQLNFPKNEIKLNAFALVVGDLEVTYERLLDEELGVGVSLFVPYDDDNHADDAYLNFSFSAYSRFYLGKKPAAGFFVEAFGMLDTYTQPASDEDLSDSYFDPEKKVTDFALGFGLGGKWITQRGFMLEINGGIGRNLFNSDDTDYHIVGRFGITLGYRFK